MSDISDMDWAQHIKMDYAQNQRKDPNTAKKDPVRVLSAHFSALQYNEFCSNFI